MVLKCPFCQSEHLIFIESNTTHSHTLTSIASPATLAALGATVAKSLNLPSVLGGVAGTVLGGLVNVLTESTPAQQCLFMSALLSAFSITFITTDLSLFSAFEFAFSGEVYKSNGITSDWYDEEKNERNRNKNVEENYIPSNLKANPRFFKFIFFPLHQKLVCEVKDPENEIQIGLLEKFLKKLIITDKLQDKFGRIIVSTVPEVISAEKIINSKTLKRIHICIEKPESDADCKLVQKIISHMVDTNTESYMQTYIAGKNDFLSLNDQVKELIQFAIEQGIIEYKTENQEGLIEDKSTAESNPLIVRVQYDPDVTDQHYLIQSKALEIVSSIN